MICQNFFMGKIVIRIYKLVLYDIFIYSVFVFEYYLDFFVICQFKEESNLEIYIVKNVSIVLGFMYSLFFFEMIC